MTEAAGLQGEASHDPSIPVSTPSELLGPMAAAGYDAPLVEAVRDDFEGGDSGEAVYSSLPSPVTPGTEAVEAAPSESVDTAPQQTDVTPAKPEAKPAPPDVPAHISEAASRVVEAFVARASNRRREISLGRLAYKAFGKDRLPRKEFQAFVRIIEQHPQLERTSTGRFVNQKPTVDSTAPASETSSRPDSAKAGPKALTPQELDDLLGSMRRDPKIRRMTHQRVRKSGRYHHKTRPKWLGDSDSPGTRY